MLTGEDDLHPATDLAHLCDHGSYAFIDAVHFPRNLFTTGQEGVNFSESYSGSTAIETGHSARHHLTNQRLVFDELRVSFGLSILLDHDLLGGLNRNPSQDGPQIVRFDINSRTAHGWLT